jgi:NAD(P)-dependent dehydrogenase (short-subunit alcohol dehydrogenase family)
LDRKGRIIPLEGDAILSVNNLAGKTYVVTGATSGIGFALTQHLLGLQASVIAVGRSRERCEQARRHLMARFPEAQLEYCVADLALQAQIHQLTDELAAIHERWKATGLDGLVNNAGTFTFWRTLTVEGIETQWAVNHLAPFLLTSLLLPLLQVPSKAKIVTVSSGSHRNTTMRWDDLQLRKFYNPVQAYKQTKLANVLFSFELNRRLGPKSTVHAYAVDPGLVNTEMGNKTGLLLAGWYWKYRRRKGIPAEDSAAGIVSLLINPDARPVDGIYWKHGKPSPPDPDALDPAASKRLWRISREMCDW